MGKIIKFAPEKPDNDLSEIDDILRQAVNECVARGFKPITIDINFTGLEYTIDYEGENIHGTH